MPVRGFVHRIEGLGDIILSGHDWSVVERMEYK
jgi:hypothetical protein